MCGDPTLNSYLQPVCVGMLRLAFICDNLYVAALLQTRICDNSSRVW